MNKIKITILVPTFNAEKYLAQCLDSLIGQTLEEIEILCINDGSTDNSLNIIKKYSSKDNRITILDKNNTGYGDSMNQGLEIAKGEYIGILEPDDFIELDTYESLYRCASKYDVDVVRANYFHYLKGKDTLHQVIPKEFANKVSNPSENQFIFMEPPAIWSSIYRKSFLKNNKIQFLPSPGASYQDAGFIFKVLASTDKVYYLDKAFLYYRRDNEASSVHQKNKVMCVRDEFRSVEEFLIKNNKISVLINVMERAKFRSYCWNMAQLASDLSMKFLDTIRDEFRLAEKNYSDFYYYFNIEEKGAYRIIMNMPKRFVVLFFKVYRRIIYGKY